MEKLSAIELAKNIRDKKISCLEAAQFFLDRIEKYNGQLNAVITVNDDIIKQAKALDQNGLTGKPLEGVPILFKDMFCTKNIKTTAGSKILSNFVPPYSATVVERLSNAGALILGKCNQDEFAMGSTNETSYFGACKNPWNLDYTPGGSSGGSAVAVASSFAPIAMGTDTGGSIRQPGHYCNVFGVKPSYGRVSRYGIIAYASSLDQAGSFSQTIEDGALITHIISGQDEKDSTTSANEVPPWHKLLNKDMKNLTIGWSDEFAEQLDPAIQKSYETARTALKDAGAKLKEIKLPLREHVTSVYYLITSCEASSNLARYDGIRYGHSTKQKPDSLEDFYLQTRGEGFGSEVKRRILMGTFCLSQGYYEAYFEKAQKVRRLLKNEFTNLFKTVDAIITPVTSQLPPKIGAQKHGEVSYYASDALTISSNLAGLPSMSVPTGIFNKFPVGVQVMGPAFEEQTLFNISYFLQEELQAYKNKPPFFLKEDL